jgi:hypothetical protein
MDLVTPEATIPAPDNLLVGPRGAVSTDIVRLRAAADSTVERGTLLMSGEMDSEKVFLLCTVEGLGGDQAFSLTGDAEDVTVAGGKTFAILADSVTVAAGEHAEIAAYFEGDFNSNAIILPWEIDGDDHDEQIEVAREALRRQKIFLRNVHK